MSVKHVAKNPEHGGPHWTIEWLEKVRLQKNIPLSQLSRMIDVSPWTYTSWRDGVNQPRIDDIERIANVLGFKLAIEGKDE